MPKLIERTTIEIEQGDAGLYYATSPDIKGLLVAKRTVAECWADIPRAIAEIRALTSETGENHD
jgi:hypothetical protein